MLRKKLFLLFIILVNITSSTHPANSLADQALVKYLEKPRFTKTGLADFFIQQFNNNLYNQFLSRCLVHVIDFLDYAKSSKKPTSFVIKVFNLFDQRIKECSWINAYALIALMDEFVTRLPAYCSIEEQGNRQAQIRAELKKLYAQDKQKYKKNSDLFFETASRAIDGILQPPQEHMDALELQLRATKFLEEAIGKLIWNPHDQLEIWHNVCAIATKLQELHHVGVIGSLDDLNILTWALIYRFGYFIDCAGSQLNADFFKEMADDIGHNKIPAFMTSEQEHFLLPKKQYLEGLIAQGKAKSAAAQSGLYVDGIL